MQTMFLRRSTHTGQNQQLHSETPMKFLQMCLCLHVAFGSKTSTRHEKLELCLSSARSNRFVDTEQEFLQHNPHFIRFYSQSGFESYDTRDYFTVDLSPISVFYFLKVCLPSHGLMHHYTMKEYSHC